MFNNAFFSDSDGSKSFMRLLCFLSFIQSCVLCYLGIFYSKDGITLELGSVIFTYISASFLGKHYSKFLEVKKQKQVVPEEKPQILNEG